MLRSVLSKIFIALSAVAIPIFAYAQGTQDAQAVSVLTSCLNASGGSTALAAVQDFQATGTVTYYWADQNVPGTITVKGRGSTQFRVDALLVAGTRSWVVSNGTGTLVNTDGSRSSIPYYNGINVGILSWRFPNVLAAIGDASVSISYVGLVQSDAGQAYQIHVQKTDSTNPDPTLASIQAIDYFIDPSSYYLLETLDSNYSLTDLTQAYPHTVLYSDYRGINGVVAPFSVTEKVNGQSTWSMQLSTIGFNVGLTDADFTL